MGTAVERPDGTADERSGGRIEHFRARAEAARLRYEELAQRQPLYGLPLTAFATYAARQGMLLASAIAFRLFFWVLPVVLLLVALLSAFGRSDSDLRDAAVDSTGISGAARAEVISALSEGGRSWWILAIIGLFGVLWTTMLLRRTLVLVNAHLWEASVGKTRTRQLVVSVLFFVALVSLVAFSAKLVGEIDSLFPGSIVVALLGQALVTGACWFAVMRQLPDRRSDWTDLIPGALVFGIGLSLMHLVSRIYLPARFEHSSALYGSLGIAAAMLVWLLLFGQLVVWSGIVSAVWHDYRAARRDGEQDPAARI
jgi:uncharacterized BrkB/YihY/UPF0761 family membrane protein